MIVANDPTVRGGAVNPYTLKKTQRAGDIALANRLPMVNLVESGGADLPTQAEIFIPGGRSFRDLTRLSAARIPTVAVVFGNATAGGAYVPGMSDYTIFVQGPGQGLPRRPAAGEDGHRRGDGRRDARRRGHARHALGPGRLRRRGRARRAPARPPGAGPGRRSCRGRAGAARPGAPAPRYDADELLGVASADLRVALRPARGARPGPRRLRVRRVQARATAPRW